MHCDICIGSEAFWISKFRKVTATHRQQLHFIINRINQLWSHTVANQTASTTAGIAVTASSSVHTLPRLDVRAFERVDGRDILEADVFVVVGMIRILS
jgi:hypothetical protein